MKFIQHSSWLLGVCACLVFSTPALAGWMCDSLGIGCGTDGADGVKVDQNNPPEVFSFTISGTFKDWTDIPHETFICDTRKREDRACIWEGYIPEIKRNATLVFEPFPHDRGMYEVRALIAHNLGKDTNYAAHIGFVRQWKGEDYLEGFYEVSLSSLASEPFRIHILKRNYKGEIDFKTKFGQLEVAFKEVLK